MSEEKSQLQSERFRDVEAIIDVVDTAYDCGIHAFMFNTHDRVAALCDHFRTNPDKYADLRLYPSMPYAHKYANAVNEKGMVGALNEFLFVGPLGQVLKRIAHGVKSVVNMDLMQSMRLLVDVEMGMFRDLNVRCIFLQNIVTDLLLGMGNKQVFIEFVDHVKNTYGVEPGFNTMDMPKLVDFLLDCGIENPIVCSSINKIGYFMNPDKASYEEAIRTKPFRPIAMSILASGAISPEAAIEYIASLRNVRSIVFGASSRSHIEETTLQINKVLSN
jgi:hypothetical protein